MSELLKVFEDGIEKDFPEGSPFFNGDHIGVSCIVVVAYSCHYKALEGAIVVDLDFLKQSMILSWLTALQGRTLIIRDVPSSR